MVTQFFATPEIRKIPPVETERRRLPRTRRRHRQRSWQAVEQELKRKRVECGERSTDEELRSLTWLFVGFLAVTMVPALAALVWLTLQPNWFSGTPF